MSVNAIDLLKQDHVKLRALLSDLIETGSDRCERRARLLRELKRELEAHSTIEQEIFYPAMLQTLRGRHISMYFEARQEHRTVHSLLIPDLEHTHVTTEAFRDRARRLRSVVEHRAVTEEEEMFPLARAALSDEQLEEIGELMANRRLAFDRPAGARERNDVAPAP